ncbi:MULTISPECIES: divergent polysaccharide deacetylase family protein [Methylobacterium]|uniref:Divergent polysaccharide deacetylase family protein n=2 Tax=Pseudomonadota TaxID=1224 RepID=A0ABQ4SYQ7_9HYPH|nr:MULTISPECIES: divergent polysaccharide deacetylase family protein [Methylobacterium]PIU04997.1 MAG: hypothetical protein COT56_17160 [Methylobacterium sp. CG09_land_8_20_14_0_10_71_15]PIU11498.1 MAG: hypothetical protein COT28_19655 [Methylobacterium sp. CG08_land_8_20_14_0_20_71_15]GBU16564.1 hypothetical protein AwMethylo_07790 [Methylobacterium sp.]GJE07630.1 hypothetical protein AOPFMNJM_2959 [Methylobacterium jeotgali]
MSEPADDILTRPLGVAPPPEPGLKGQVARLRALSKMRPVQMGALAGVPLVALALLLLLGDKRGGEPRATVAITLRAPVAAAAPQEPPVQAAEAVPAPESAAAQRSAEQIETASGVTVVRPDGTSAPSEAVVIRVPSAPVKLGPAPDPRLVERGRHGAIPRLGEGRLRALDLYARPDTEGGTGPRIAILVSGLGVGQSATARAIVQLPPAVTLAFSPYGAETDKMAARARDFGHEVMLQAPMEPFDYPDSDPGPQTLLTGLRPAEASDRLAWMMSRFPGFTGLVNFMGAKLMSDPAAFEPVLREIGARGLGFVDDGTAPRSQAVALAGRLKTPAARAEIVLDAQPRPDAIDRELARLEAAAREKGFAMASATALPLSIERIARWAKDLDARGIRLVPVSVALRGRAAPGKLSKAE